MRRITLASALAVLPLGGLAHAQAYTLDSQSRSVFGSAYAFDYLTKEDFSDAESDTAPDDGHFDVGASGTVSPDDGYASGGGTQDSAFESHAIRAAGSCFANAEAYTFDIESDASGGSSFEAIFIPTADVVVTLTGSISATDNGFVDISLVSSFRGVSFSVSASGPSEMYEIDESFELAAGVAYTLRADANGGAYADGGFMFDYAFSDFDLTLTFGACVGDLDADGVVGASDLAVLLAAWGGPGADLNNDGVTDSGDLAVLLAAWGPCP